VVFSNSAHPVKGVKSVMIQYNKIMNMFLKIKKIIINN